jgi:hypothetical protein
MTMAINKQTQKITLFKAGSTSLIQMTKNKKSRADARLL